MQHGTLLTLESQIDIIKKFNNKEIIKYDDKRTHRFVVKLKK